MIYFLFLLFMIFNLWWLCMSRSHYFCQEPTPPFLASHDVVRREAWVGGWSSDLYLPSSVFLAVPSPHWNMERYAEHRERGCRPGEQVYKKWIYFLVNREGDFQVRSKWPLNSLLRMPLTLTCISLLGRKWSYTFNCYFLRSHTTRTHTHTHTKKHNSLIPTAFSD